MVLKKIKTPSVKIFAHKVGNKPYYEVEYFDMEDKKTHIGYSSYDLTIVTEYVSDCFDIIPDCCPHCGVKMGNENND